MSEGNYLAALHGLRLAHNTAQVESNEHYQAIRDQINSRIQAPDWRKIKQHAIRLGREDGLTLLAAAYYATALVKTDGISGLSEGLEVVLAAFYQQEENQAGNSLATTNALSWMASRVKDQVPTDHPVRVDLSLLYRCECICRVLNQKAGTDIPSLQALQHRIARQVQQIMEKHPKRAENQPQSLLNRCASDNQDAEQQDEEEETTPAPHPARKSTPWWIALAAILVILLVGELVVWQPNQLPYITAANQPADYIAPLIATPQILTESQIRQIRQTQDRWDIQQDKARISRLYLDAIQHHLTQNRVDSTAQAEQLADTLHRLYPDNLQAAQQKELIQARRTAREAQMTDQWRRFEKFRTNAANLNRAIQNLNGKSDQHQRIKTLAQDLADYAISLSPLLGRSLYIEDQLEQQAYQTAERELNKLNQQIDALTLHASRLKRALQTQSPMTKPAKPNVPNEDEWAFF